MSGVYPVWWIVPVEPRDEDDRARDDRENAKRTAPMTTSRVTGTSVNENTLSRK